MSVERALCHLTKDGSLEPGTGPRGSIRIWPYTQGWKWQRRRFEEHLLDPVNVVVVGQSPRQVMAALAGEGWELPSSGGIHRLWVNRILRPMRTHATLGSYDERTHVRLWNVGGHTVAAAHHEYADDRRHHIVTTWDGARGRVAAALTAAGYESNGLGDIVTLPGIRGLANDGRVLTLSSR